MRLAACDEGRQPLDVLLIGRYVRRPRLPVLRLLMLFARIEGLGVARRKRLAAHRRLLAIAIVIAVIGEVAALLALLLIIGLALPELFLRGCNQTEVMFRVLIVILGSDRVSGTLRITGKL